MNSSEMLDPSIIKKVFWKLSLPAMKLLMLVHKVRSKNVKIYGYPRISNNGTISIGKGTEIFSTNAYYLTTASVSQTLLKTYKNGNIRIGKNVRINGTSIVSARSIDIGDNTLIGSNVVIIDTNVHPIDPRYRLDTLGDKVESKEIVIGSNVWIGINCIILKGVSIGNNSIIGAGSVVTKSIPEDCIAAGNPAKIIKSIK